MTYCLAALGGTFDRFHEGHKTLLQSALSAADACVIGVTQSISIQSKTLNHLIEPYEDRINHIRDFLRKIGAGDRATIVPLNDPYGPTLTDPNIDVLIVSTQTRSGGEAINAARSEKGLPRLPIIETPMIKDDSGEHLSSTLIRLGKTTRSGRTYRNLFVNTITFSKQALSTISEVQGELVGDETITADYLQQFTQVGVVGDVVTSFFIDKQLPFNIAVIDGHTKREIDITKPISAINLSHENRPGCINHDVVEEIIAHLSNAMQQLILSVNGEEDLLAFVLCLMFPLDSAVFYGQPGRGIVMIRLTESVKLRLAALIDPSFR